MTGRSGELADYLVTVGDVSLREPFLPLLVLGPPRTGKTTLVAAPILQAWPGPSIVTSVRSDIVAQTARKRAGDGSRVYVFDPASAVLGAELGVEVEEVGFNPIDLASPWDEAIRVSAALKDAGQVVNGLQDPGFWYELAGQLLAPLLFAAARSGYGMADVRRWVKTEDDFEVRALLQAAGNEDAIIAFEAATSREERSRSAVFTTLEICLGAYNTDDSIALAAKNPITPERFFDEARSGPAPTLFLCAPPAAQAEYRPIFIMMIRYFLDFAYRTNTTTPPVWDAKEFRAWITRGAAPPTNGSGSRQAKNIPLLLMLDEAGNVASLRSFDTLVSTAAGSGIQVVSVFHDLSQMVTLYGESRATSAFNNHSAVVILPGTRDETLRRLVNDDPRTLPTGTALLINENLPPQTIRLNR